MAAGAVVWPCAVGAADAPVDEPGLWCEVTYAGATHRVDVRPAASPYAVSAVDIGGRFGFKPVWLVGDSRWASIKFYVYLDTRRQPLLVHHSHYRPPYPRTPPGTPFTGWQTVIAGPVERELMYGCFLQGGSP